jgi:hypothetical protein
MASAGREIVPVGIRRVQEQFERWRAGKQSRERIPPSLWAAAVKLCGTSSVHRVARWLHLNPTALQARASGRVKACRSEPKPAFVEWGLPAGIFAGASSAEYVVEVAGREDGPQRIHVRGASVAEVAALAGALRGKG